jgi:hypothetical protein
MKKDVILIRPGRVSYVDLCVHENVSRTEFFTDSNLKHLTYYGLIMEGEELVKVWHCDDVSDDSEGAGIVIPTSCVTEIVYFIEDLSGLAPKIDGTHEVN